MKNSKLVLDKLSKILEQGLTTSRDLGSEILNKNRNELYKIKLKS